MVRRLGRALRGGLVALLLLSAGAASAQPAAVLGGQAIIATLPFDGHESAAPPPRPLQVMPTASTLGEVLMGRPQSTNYRVLPPDVFGGLARIKYRGRAPDLRAMARLLKANLLLGGWLEATPGPDAPKPYRLTLTVYDADGQLVGQLAYDVDSPTLNPIRLRSQATAFFQMVDGALKLPGPASPVAAPPPMRIAAAAPPPPPALPSAGSPVSSGPVRQAEDQETAPLGPADQSLVPRTPALNDIFDRRGPWQTAVDVRAGFLYSARQLTNDGSPLSFPRSGASGLLLHLDLHPLAFLKQSSAAAAGLGVRVTAQLPFWGTLQQVNEQGGTVGSVKAGESRVDVALRWHLNYWDDVLRPDIELEALFGDHQFTFDPKTQVNLAYLHVPPSEYRYLGGLIGVRLFFTRRLSGRLAFSLAKDVSLGLMDTPGIDAAGKSISPTVNGFQSYGPGRGWLWRTDLGFTAELFRGITAGAAFFYEQNKLSFDGQGNILQASSTTTAGAPVTTAQDEYLGFMLTIGYAFRPWIH
jgi:hypothetical protein